jgi:hypothetical protein
MTQPIDVAYVDIVSNSKDFRKELSREMDAAVKDIEKQSQTAATKVEHTFKKAGEGAHGFFRDVNGRLHDSQGRFVALGEAATEALSGTTAAAAKVAQGLFQQIFGVVSNLIGGISQLAASGPVGIALMVAGFAALAAAISAAAAVLQGFLTIAAAGLAALPGLVLAAVSGFAILGVAMSGVIDAFQEQASGAKKAGGAAVNNARQIADAQRGILEAQRDLIKARETELKRIRDIDIALNRARVTEARAIDDVKNAQLELQDARNLNSPRAEKEAQLRLDEANATLLEARARTKDLAADKKKADKVGVEGSEAVLAAQERLLDAQDRLAASMAKMGGGAAGQATAFSQLTKSAQAFVTALVSAKEQLGPVADAIQEAFFEGSAPLIQPIVDNIKSLQPELTRVSAGFGKIFQEVLKFLGSPEAKNALDSILTGLAEFLEAVAPSIQPLLKAFAGLAGQAGEFGGELGGVVADALMNIADFVKNVDLKKLFEDAKKAIKDILPIIKPLLSITKDLFVILVEFGKVALPPLAFTLAVVAAGFRILGTVVKGFFDFAQPAFDWLKVNAPKAIKTVADAIIGLPGKITNAGASMLEAGKKFIGKFFEGIGAAGGFVADFAKKLANAFIGVINSQVINPINRGIRKIQDALNSLPFFDDVSLATIPNIPRLAKGGLSVKNRLVEISEGDREEAVIPLENQRVLSKVGTAIADAGGSGRRGRAGDNIQVMVFIGNEPVQAQAVKVVDASNKKVARTVKQVPRMV